MPLVGGELARGAFTYGDAPYGFDHLRRYAQLIELTKASYLWYYPDGRAGIAGPDTLATDGWGASAMIGALIEGAAGIKDRGKLYQAVEISPHWSATPDITRTEVVAHYPASDRYVAYQWALDYDPPAKRGQLRLDVTGTWQRARLRLLLPPQAPKSASAYTVRLDGQPQASEIRKVGGSRYIIVEASNGGCRCHCAVGSGTMMARSSARPHSSTKSAGSRSTSVRRTQSCCSVRSIWLIVPCR